MLTESATLRLDLAFAGMEEIVRRIDTALRGLPAS
jgi:hypothetical protein